MKIMESRVKSIIREEVGRAIRSRLLREADPDYPYPPDARSNRERDAYFARGEDPAEAAAERAMAGEDDEGDDDYYGDDDPFGDDAVIAAGVEDGGGGSGGEVVLAFKRMQPKPQGLIIDCSEMEGSGGGRYPAYMAIRGKIKKISNDVGEIAFDLVNMLDGGDVRSLPPGLYVAGPRDDDDGNMTFEISN